MRIEFVVLIGRGGSDSADGSGTEIALLPQPQVPPRYTTRAKSRTWIARSIVGAVFDDIEEEGEEEEEEEEEKEEEATSPADVADEAAQEFS